MKKVKIIFCIFCVFTFVFCAINLSAFAESPLADEVCISFDFDGGSAPVNNLYFTDIYVNRNDEYRLRLDNPDESNLPFKSNYVLLGFKDSVYGDVYLLESNEAFVFVADRDITFIAVWKFVGVTVEFAVGDEIVETKQFGVSADDSRLYFAQENIVAPSVVGKKFIGWKTYDAHGNGIPYEIYGNASDYGNHYLVIPADTQNTTIRLVAEFVNVYNISFYVDDEEYYSVSVTEGEEFTVDSLSIPAPVKEGYVFVGWELDGNIIDNDTVIQALNGMSFTASFRPIEIYTVTLHYGDREEIMEVAENSADIILNEKTFADTFGDYDKENCPWLGWYIADKPNETERELIINVDKSIDGLHIYAATDEKITVVFCISNEYKNITVNGWKSSGVAALSEKDVPVIQGYELLGWALSYDGEVIYPVDNCARIYESRTLYAVWSKLFYTVTFVVEDTAITRDILKSQTSYTLQELIETFTEEELLLIEKQNYNIVWYDSDKTETNTANIISNVSDATFTAVFMLSAESLKQLKEEKIAELTDYAESIGAECDCEEIASATTEEEVIKAYESIKQVLDRLALTLKEQRIALAQQALSKLSDAESPSALLDGIRSANDALAKLLPDELEEVDLTDYHNAQERLNTIKQNAQQDVEVASKVAGSTVFQTVSLAVYMAIAAIFFARKKY